MGTQTDKSNLFRKQSIERVKSPEQLNDYLHVTSPAIWVVLVTVLMLMGVLFAWSAFTAYESSAMGHVSPPAWALGPHRQAPW